MATRRPYYPGPSGVPTQIASPDTIDSAILPLTGGVVSGPPTTGTHRQFELYPDSLGVLWVCTVAGTPGTWVASSGQPPGVVPGTRMVGLGHSWLTGTGSSSIDRGLVELVAGATGADIDNFSVNSALLGHDNTVIGNSFSNPGGGFGWAAILQEQTFIGVRTAAPRTPNGSVPFILFGINDVGAHHADTGNNPRTVFKESLRTAISRVSASQVYDDIDGSIAYGALTWGTRVATDNYVAKSALSMSAIRKLNHGLGYHPFPGNTATFTITLPTDFEGGVVAVGMIAYPGSDAVITWSGTVSAATGTTTLVGKAYNPAGGAGTLKRASNNGVVQRFTCLASDAGKTIIGTVGSMSATRMTTPSAPGAITHGGTPATTTYTYAWVAGNENGDTPESTTTSTTTGAATLTGTNTNIIPAPTFPTGATYMKLVRTVGSAGTPSTGHIATIQTSAAVTDTGQVATAYTNPTVSPAQVGGIAVGGALDYWQIEATNPVQPVLVCNVCRGLPGGLPLQGVNKDGGFLGGQGYTSANYQNVGQSGITAGGTVGATTVTIASGGFPASITVGSVVQLTGGTAESFYVSAVNSGTGVITLSNVAPPAAQAGFVRNASHALVTYGWPQDADVVNYNADIASVVAEFSSSVVVVDLDTPINLNQVHYFTDGLHLNDRGTAIGAGAIAKSLGIVMTSLTTDQVAAVGRGPRRPENVAVYMANGFLGNADVTFTNIAQALMVDSLGNPIAVSIACKPGDEIELFAHGLWSSAVPAVTVDVATKVGGVAVNYISSGLTTAGGILPWGALANATGTISGSYFYVVQLADWSGGFVTFQMSNICQTNAGRLLWMGSFPFQFGAKNRGVPSYTYAQ